MMYAKPIGIEISQTGKIVARAFDDMLAAAGGSLAVWQVLATLAQGEPEMQRRMATSIGIEDATLTHHLSRMESRGLVSRERDPNNQRIQRVSLTPTGRTLFETLLERVIAFDAQLRQGLRAEEVSTLRTLLAHLRVNCAQKETSES